MNWLPKRIYRDPSNINDSIKRVIVIHSPLPLTNSHAIKNEQDEANTSDPLLDNSVGVEKWLQGSGSDHRVTTDPEFLYGMQLLLGCIQESVENNPGHQSIYSRVFNVRYDTYVCMPMLLKFNFFYLYIIRYTDIADSSDNENLVYPNLQLAPFTCYLLPDHFNQLLQHITASQ